MSRMPNIATGKLPTGTEMARMTEPKAYDVLLANIRMLYDTRSSP